MAEVQKTVLIHYSPELMFDLVTDVTDYPNFLPWCSGVEIKHQDKTSMEAQINICFKGIRQHFTTYNKQERPEKIDIEFKEGPFRRFTGSWSFIRVQDNACKIEFSLQYIFSNIFLEQLIGPMFDHISNTLVESFIKRAEERYGKHRYRSVRLQS
ncbi:type II toxin-antitoxin system RatA family toxin [Candidatus Vallotia lariciata]|uniref:type II toxin-antitoxin system RatA family toxin n=1 Tax=Candidatus Vallotia laricis TaxID=2018052 RepID=UPI001D01866B|nr:type II toxin-antitoxin system RatA family toxin [Candidatus Vallotia lariciata]UDG83044.1 Persistence and stress-resistance toxin PasT [Candidatus Vallotia lariciata]